MDFFIVFAVVMKLVMFLVPVGVVIGLIAWTARRSSSAGDGATARHLDARSGSDIEALLAASQLLLQQLQSAQLQQPHLPIPSHLQAQLGSKMAELNQRDALRGEMADVRIAAVRAEAAQYGIF
ncbi:MAG: hypothetical protein KC503_37530 [Myxococcales bacterium]|nr:hypothetical protein [Myxococcales bacterium]